MNVLQKYLKVRLLIPIALMVVVGLVALLWLNARNAGQPAPKAAISQNLIDKQPVASVPGLPVRLKIPTINVDAAIESLVLTPVGDLETPKGIGNAGWYSHGPRPGGMGSAVIDGHYGLANNKPAVFDNLHSLQKDDKLYIEDTKGVTYGFVVREVRLYSPNDDASTVFRSGDNKAHLNLITCQGSWEQSTKSYSSRLVVFADMIAI